MSDDTSDNSIIDYDEVELDYSHSSGALGSSEKEYDTSGVPEYSEIEGNTTWLDGETDGKTIERFGKEMDEWEWKKRLNSGREVTDKDETDGCRGLTDWIGERRMRGRYNDLLMLVDKLQGVTEYEKNWLHRKSFRIFMDIRDSDDDFRFGGKRPIESAEIATLSLVAREMIDVDGFEEIDKQKEIHSLAFDGEAVQRLCDIWTPKGVEIRRKDVRSVRGDIRECITE